MQNLSIYFSVIIILAVTQVSFSTTIDGSTGLIRVPYASTLGKGKLLVNGQSATTMQLGQTMDVNYYHATNQFGAIYGMNRFWDLWFNFREYQDNPAKGSYGWGNLKIGSKYNFYNNRRNRYNLSGEMLTIFPTGKWANVPWEPFSSGQLELQLNLLGSYHKYYHGVFGYTFHNDSDQGYTGGGRQPVDIPGESATHSLFFALGAEYPVIKDILIGTAELTNRFVLNAKTNTHSSEPWTILTIGAKYFLSNTLFFSGGIDLRILGGTNNTSILNPAALGGGKDKKGFYADTDNYPLWQIHLDVNWLAYQRYRVIRSERDSEEDNAAASPGEGDAYLDLLNDFGEVGMSQELQEKMRLYRKLKMQQKETKEAEKELAEIKHKRKEAESELQKLRNLLEELD